MHREGSDSFFRHSGTYLLDEAKEKCAGVLGEKFRGLSRGLLPVSIER